MDAEEERQQLAAQLGVPVLPERVGVARLLWRIWVERGQPLGRHKKVLRALADELGLGLSPQLFAEWVGTTTKPQIEKIQAVADKTGSDLVEWLYEFGLLRTPPRRSDLSPAEQAVIAQYRRLGPQRGQTWLKIGSLLEDEPTPGSQDASSARGPRPAPPRAQ